MVGRELRKFKRINLKKPLKIAMRSIGSDGKYKLTSSNISSSGLFLEFDKPQKFPFTTESIIEIWIDLDNDNSVFCNGKLVRVVYPEDDLATIRGPGIGIKIIQISTENQELLDKFIDNNSEEEGLGKPTEEKQAS